MSVLLEEVRLEIVDLHDFFKDWFNGKADRSKLDASFISRLHPDLIFIPPEGRMLRVTQLKAGFERSHGTNPDFRIQIRDVQIHRNRPVCTALCVHDLICEHGLN